MGGIEFVHYCFLFHNKPCISTMVTLEFELGVWLSDRANINLAEEQNNNMTLP